MRFSLRWLLVLAPLLLCGGTLAQGYPSRPIRIVVPFPPGGTSDILSRLTGPRLTEKWGQPVIVESRPGAAGAIGADVVAKSAPDGYTLLLSDVGSLLIIQVLYPKTTFDLTRDFAAVTTVSYSPHLLCVHPNVPVSTVPQLIALAKQRPGALNFASSPAGAPYLAGVQFAHRTGIRWEYITGRGGAQSVMDMKERLQQQGADPIGSPPAESAKFLRDERDRFTKLVKETGYKPQ